MTFTHTLGVTYKSDAGLISSSTISYTGDGEFNFDEIIVAPATNKEFDLGSIVDTKIKSMVLYSTKNCTIHTNTATTGTEDITLVAGKELVWDVDSNFAKPFSAPVTKFFIDVPGTVPARVRFSALLGVAI